ncbi:hypothetical protein Zm00014a_024860 [Zea mays]|jgi:hypothetical protein|uniref:Endonuclease/exonuclease/phosphatase domain-containing protein n=1 Tax=Zea mays TaxID=4577 RepID=A0A3L6DEL3_MAIZE|nr:hypothetical protein Zm00014a_024860 [Zea mays]
MSFNWVSSEPNGRSGGLLFGFNSDTVDIISHNCGKFLISSIISHKEKNFSWKFLNVYGAAQEVNKRDFLCELASFCHNSSVPLLIGGDFNIIRRESDKNKPGGTNKWSFLFNAIIEQHGLIELDLVGRQYTWSNNRLDPTFEKLDRFLVSPEWDLAYRNVIPLMS